MSEFAALSMNMPVETPPDFMVFEEGIYDFKIIHYERQQAQTYKKQNLLHDEIELTLEISQNGDVLGQFKPKIIMVNDTFPMRQYCHLAKSIGHNRPDDKACFIRWNEITGAVGKCKLTVAEYEKRDGSKGTANRIDYLPAVKEDTSFPPADVNSNEQW